MTTNTVTTTTTDISLAKLVPCPANVRRTGAGTGIEALAASIQAHGLLQSLAVRPKLDGEGQASDRYEVVAGGRRLAALKLLAKQKRITKSTAIPCRVLDADSVDVSEASLAENIVRQDMHPADQFEAFHGLHQGGIGIEDIAARFGVFGHTVRQRLRLACVSPALIQAYRDEELTLDHLTAFAVSEEREAETIRAEGWRWVGIGQEAQAAAWNLRRVWPDKVALSAEDDARRSELAARHDEIAEEHNGGGDDLPDDVAAELDRIEAELAALEEAWQPADVAIGGVILTIAADGSLRIERGYVGVEDEPKAEPVTSAHDGGAEPEDKAPAPSAALLAELEAHRTAGLQAALAWQPQLALRVMALATDALYSRYGQTILALHTYPPALASAARYCRQPGAADHEQNRGRMAHPSAPRAWRVLGVAAGPRCVHLAQLDGRVRRARRECRAAHLDYARG